MKKLKKFRMTAALLSSVLLFSSCGENTYLTLSNPQSTNISFSWWGNDSRHDYTLPAVTRFEELFPDIDVKCHYSEWSGYQNRNSAQMASNTESDVMQINYSWLNQYSADGRGYYDLSTLSEYIDFSSYTEEELSYGMQNGKLNAIPIALNTMTMYYNKTVYDQYGLELPKTFDDLFRAAEVMKGEHYPLALSQKPAWFLMAAYVKQKTGREIMNYEGNITANRDDIKLMLELYKDMVDKKVIPTIDDFDKREFANGKYASTMVWLSDASNYCSGAEANGYTMVIGDYPTVNGSLQGWYVKPATLYAIRKNTANPAEAAQLLNYLVNSEDMALFQKTEKGIPLSKSARDTLIKNDELGGIQKLAFDRMSENQERMTAQSPYFETDILHKSFASACTEIMFGKIPLDEQADALYEIIKNYRNTQE